MGYLILGRDQLERLPTRRALEQDLRPILEFTTKHFLGETPPSAEELLTRGSAGLERLGLDWVRERLKANGKRRVVIVPYGILTTFPFAASRNAGRYLIEDYEVAISPSLVLAAQGGKPDEQVRRPRAVLIGDADPDREASKAEIENLSQWLRPRFDVDTLVAQRCNRREVLSALATKPTLVHLAGHGSSNYFSRDKEALILGPDASDGNHVVSSADLREHVKLARGTIVVLSYCSGLLSRSHGANDFQGMTATFLDSGASAVVGALRPVYDEVAAKFVAVFYDRLLDADDPVTALTTAQRALLHDGCDSYEWAPFAAIVCG